MHLRAPMTAAPTAIAPGDVFGPYRVIGELAGGGYRALREGRSTSYWLEVAATDWRAASVRMMRAAQVVESLHHPGVARIVDHGVDKRAGKRAWQATELPAGVALYDVISRRVMTAAEVTKLVRDVADVLAHAHARGVVHRALAMRAIVIPTGERRTSLTSVCIADWGHAPCDIGVYAAPELAAGRAIDGRVDVYALGVIAFRAAAGRFPVPPIDDVPGAPAALALLIARMLATDPAERPTAAEVGALASELAAGVPLSSLEPPQEVVELEAFVNDDVVIELVTPRFSKPKWTPAPPLQPITSDAGAVSGEIPAKSKV